MNFLAHLYLSPTFDDIMIGNFIADSVKGRDFTAYSPEVASGINLHRLIDSYTDNHFVFCRSKLRLRKNYGKFAGVITDIFYDHFLAANWLSYSKEELSVFSNKVYDHMQLNFKILPSKVQILLPRMIENNWLYNYRLIEGIREVLIGMSKRTKFDSGMERATKELKSDYLLFKSDFEEFFPDLINYVKNEKPTIIS